LKTKVFLINLVLKTKKNQNVLKGLQDRLKYQSLRDPCLYQSLRHSSISYDEIVDIKIYSIGSVSHDASWLCNKFSIITKSIITIIANQIKVYCFVVPQCFVVHSLVTFVFNIVHKVPQSTLLHCFICSLTFPHKTASKVRDIKMKWLFVCYWLRT
jgi:hypothetical protein